MSARAHVLFCVPDPAAGGAAAHALDLLARIDPEGFTTSLLMREARPLPARVTARCAAIHMARSMYEIAAVIRAVRPDVVQHYNNLAVLAGIELSEAAPFSVQILHANHALERDFEPLPAEETDVLVAVSDSAARLYPAADAQRAKLRVIWNGVDVAAVRPTAARAIGPVRILSVARLDDEAKRISDVIDACAQLDRGSYRLTVVGDGPDRARIEQRVAERGIHENVCFTGAVADAGRAYADADVFVSGAPSEGFGLAIAEAAAHGIAIAARRCGGVTEAMDHGEHALLSGSAADLARDVARLAGDPALRGRLGSAARALVERRFDVRRMVAEYEALYREGIAARRAAAP